MMRAVNIFPIFVFIFFSAGIIVPISSCHKNSSVRNQSNGSEYFEEILARAKSISDSGHYREALQYLESNSGGKKLSDIDEFKYYNERFSIYFNNLKDPGHAVMYADSMLSISEQFKKSKRLPRLYLTAYYAMGDVLYQTGEYQEAYKYYLKARKRASETSDSCALGYYNYKLGMALYKQEEYANAISLFKLSLSEFETCSDNTISIAFRIQEIMDNIGLSYFHSGNWDSARREYEHTLTFIEKIKKKYTAEPEIRVLDMGQGVVYDNLGSLYYAKGDTSKAEQYFKQNIVLFNNRGYGANKNIGVWLKLARLYLEKKDRNSLASILPIIDKAINSGQDIKDRISWHELNWKYYKSENKLTDALKNLQAYRILKDSSETDLKIQSRTNIGVLISSIEHENEINLLLKTNELKRNYLLISLLATILPLVIVVLVFRNWKKANKDIVQLSYLNKKVNEQNDQLETVLKALEESNIEKDRVMKAIAHDIRNPVSAISSLTDLFKADSPELGQEAKEMLGFIKESCDDALMLSTEIIDATEMGNLKNTETELTDIHILILSSIKMLSFRAKEKNQVILLKTENNSVKLNVHKEKISRVINNLIGNAIKFSYRGSEIGVQMQQKKNELIISVHDTGIGIPDEIGGSLFEMFTDAKRPGTDGEKPYGLGLSICKQIVSAHRGKIWFESVPGSGTSFYFSLPIES